MVNQDTIEYLARAIAAWELAIDRDAEARFGDGLPERQKAADERWPDHIEQATFLLKAIQQPSPGREPTHDWS